MSQRTGVSWYVAGVVTVCRSFGLSLILTLSLTLGLARRGAAQEAPHWGDLHMTLHPRAAATATRNPAAGDYSLDSLAGYTVTVPPQCVGARRCPLFVVIPSQGAMAPFIQPVIAQHGIIMLFAPGVDYSKPDVTQKLTAALTQTLRRFAIDPEKIGIMGRCHTGPYASAVGFSNPDVFTRIVVASGYLTLPPAELGRPKRRTELLISNGIHDGPLFHNEVVDPLRRRGYGVTMTIGFRDHYFHQDDHDFVIHWLEQSWAHPDPATRPAPERITPLPVLTQMGLKQLTMFWESFRQLPDSIKTVGRRAHLRAVALPVGREDIMIWMTDMAALARQYPVVATALKQAHFTPRQHDAYRVALLSALISADLPDTRTRLAQTLGFMQTAAAVPDAKKTHDDSTMAREYARASAKLRQWQEQLPQGRAAVDSLVVQERNAAWVEAHPDGLDSLAATGTWRTP